MTSQGNRVRAATWAMLGALAGGAILPISAQQSPPSPGCRVAGTVTAGGAPLPGVSIVAFTGETPTTATSTDPDGTYRLALAHGSYRIAAELTGFSAVRRELIVSATSCEQTIDLQLELAARTTLLAPRSAPQPAGERAAPRFETLSLQAQAAAAVPDAAATEREPPDAATRMLLPPGFSTEAPTEAVAISGNMASLDRGMMSQRFEAIGRGEFNPVTGEFAEGFRPGGGGEFGEGGGRGQGRGGPGGPDGQGPGARGGRGGDGFMIGGRGGRQNTYSGNANYTFGGSALDSSPYQLRADTPAEKRPYTRQNFNVTAGGPVRIPGVYNGTRRTNFNISYGGNRGSNLFDQYATVPSEAMRGGDFAAAGATVIDPATGQPFAGGQVPIERFHPAARVLLGYIPAPNLPGTARNFHYSTTSESSGDNLNLRVTHNFTQQQGGRGAGRGPGVAGGRAGGPGGRGGGRGQQGTNVTMNAQVQWRRNDNQNVNVFPTLGGVNESSSLTVPVALNVAHRRTMHNINVTFSRTSANNRNRFAFVEDVAGLAGISGIATDPFAWGVPSLSFSSLSNVRDMAPSRRSDRRFSAGYTLTRPLRNHTLRVGGDLRADVSENQTDSNARGAFVFTGLYSGGGSGSIARGSGLDFADFLLGLPQQASVQFGPGNVQMRGRSLSAFIQDEWRKSAALTLNLGVRYELLWPFLEEKGQMVNLDVPPDFTAAAPVLSGGTGAFSGEFPKALMYADRNNLAPRVGFAWRVKPGTVVRGGYGMSFNSGSYSTIARQLSAQPPFAVTNTSIGTVNAPLTLSNPLANAAPADTRNNYGVDPNYALGLVQTSNADFSRDFGQVWNLGAGYTYTRGSSLDIVRAPNRGPTGLRIPGVQPFTWQSSEGASVLHAGTFRAQRRPVKGIGGSVSYTVARSRDNASTIGGGNTVVAQDDRNLDAEWGLSSFDRRHQLSIDANIELPFGPNRPWLNNGGPWARLLENWRLTTGFTWQSGTPFTARVTGAASEVARGTNGTLRADYSGQPIHVSDPTIDRFFNTTAFTVPGAGQFGSASRNMIIGPGSRLLNAQLSRDIRLSGNRGLGLQLNASNLLNMANYASIDTVVNSPTFGQVISVRPMRSVTLGLRFRF